MLCDWYKWFFALFWIVNASPYGRINDDIAHIISSALPVQQQLHYRVLNRKHNQIFTTVHQCDINKTIQLQQLSMHRDHFDQSDFQIMNEIAHNSRLNYFYHTKLPNIIHMNHKRYLNVSDNYNSTDLNYC